MNEYISIQEAAARLSVSRQTVYQWIAGKEFPVEWVAGRRVVPLNALREWAELHAKPLSSGNRASNGGSNG
jgi:excisionase family DNA binding protein